MGHIIGVVSCLSVKRQFCTELVSWEHKACPLSGIKKGLLMGGCFCVLIVISIRAIAKCPLLCSSGRARYGRFHCIYTCTYSMRPSVLSIIQVHARGRVACIPCNGKI